MNRQLYRAVSVLIALTCIIVSGVALRFVEDSSWAASDLDQVAIGEWVELDDGLALRITGVTVGNQVVDDNDIIGISPGRFIHVTAEVRAEREKAGTTQITLHDGDTEYRDIMSAFQSTPPGFISTTEAVFEVPADAVSELQIQLRDVEFITRYVRVLVCDPELTQDDVDESRNRKVIEPASELRVIR